MSRRYTDDEALQRLRERLTILLPWLQKSAGLTSLSLRPSKPGNSFIMEVEYTGGEFELVFGVAELRKLRRLCTGDLARSVLADLIKLRGVSL